MGNSQNQIESRRITSMSQQTKQKYLARFTNFEVNLIQTIFSDLARRSDGDVISKQTFLQFFALPGLWGQQLYKKFDIKKSNTIDFEEFITGLAICCKGTDQEIKTYLFSLYDLNGDGHINKDELVTILHSIQEEVIEADTLILLKEYDQPSATKTLETQPDQNEAQHILSKDQSQQQQSSEAFRKLSFSKDQPNDSNLEKNEKIDANYSPQPKQQRKSLGRNQSPKFFEEKKVDQIANEIMKHCDQKKDNRLNFEEFQILLDRHPRILETFTKEFKQLQWQHSIHEEQKNQRTFLSKWCCCFGKKKYFTLNNIFPFQNNQDELLWSGLLITKKRFQGQRKGEKEKYFWKQKYFILKSNLLYEYNNNDLMKPIGVIFLTGCYLKEINLKDEKSTKQSQVLYGFQVSHEYSNFEKIEFYCHSQQERDQWIEKLQISTANRDINDIYDIGKQIGQGRFSTVNLGTHKISKKQVAIKQVSKQNLQNYEKDLLRQEIAIMQLLNHPNIVHLYETFDTENVLYIVMEYVQGGELFDFINEIKQVPEAIASNIIRQLAETLKYIHRIGIIHCDLKPENILIQRKKNNSIEIKLADFGLSQICGPSDKVFLPLGTLCYISPEIVLKQPYHKEVDLWGAGILLYIMLRGRAPFDGNDNSEIIRKIKNQEPNFEDQYWQKISQKAKDVVKKLLDKNPQKRLTVQKLLDHPWILKYYKIDLLEIQQINKSCEENKKNASKKSQKTLPDTLLIRRKSEKHKFSIEMVQQFEEPMSSALTAHPIDLQDTKRSQSCFRLKFASIVSRESFSDIKK